MSLLNIAVEKLPPSGKDGVWKRDNADTDRAADACSHCAACPSLLLELPYDTRHCDVLHQTGAGSSPLRPPFLSLVSRCLLGLVVRRWVGAVIIRPPQNPGSILRFGSAFSLKKNVVSLCMGTVS